MATDQPSPLRFCVKCGATYDHADTIRWCDRQTNEGQCKGEVHPKKEEPRLYRCAACQDTGMIEGPDPTAEGGRYRRKCPHPHLEEA